MSDAINPWTKVRNAIVRLQERLTSEDDVAMPTQLRIAKARERTSAHPEEANLKRMGKAWTLDRVAFEITLPHSLPQTESGRTEMWFYLDGMREAVTQREREVEDANAAAANCQPKSSSGGKRGKATGGSH